MKHPRTNGGRAPGSRRSHAYNPWTDADREIIYWAESNAITALYLFKIGKLPGRSIVDIQNQFGILRAKARGVCPKCRTVKTPNAVHCPDCKKMMREYRKSLVRQGLCCACGGPRGEGSTATTCARCREKQKNYNYKPRKHPKKDPKSIAMPEEIRCLFPWVRAASTQILANNVLPEEQVVDLFGGSGRILAWVLHNGHTVLAYNDAHPLLTRFIREALTDSQALWGRIQEELEDPEWWKKIEPRYKHRLLMAKRARYKDAGALFFLMAKATKGRMRLKPGKPSKLRPFHTQTEWLASKISPEQVTCLDFKKAIRKFDAPGVLFLADPPWPEDIGFEFGVDDRHRQMVKALMRAKGDFILVTQSSDASLNVLKGVPYLYWARVWSGREILASSRPLTEGLLTRFTLKDLGK